MMSSNSSSDPNNSQTITPFEVQLQSFNKLLSIEAKIAELASSQQTLSQTIAVSMKQNIEMMSKISDYIGEQMSYRLYRQNLEENNIVLQLKQKELELQFMQKKYDALSEEKHNDEEASESIRNDREKLRLEVETLQKNLDALKESKHSTKDRVETLKLQNTSGNSVFNTRVKETIVFTAIGTLTATGVAGIIAFVVWLLRFYIENTPH